MPEALVSTVEKRFRQPIELDGGRGEDVVDAIGQPGRSRYLLHLIPEAVSGLSFGLQVYACLVGEEGGRS